MTLAWRERAADSLGRIVEWDATAPRAAASRRTSMSRGALLVRIDGAIVRVISGEVRWMS